MEDVVIVGFGPAAQVLASLLGRAGHRVLVYEKFATPYGLPRMSTLDGEVARLLQHTCDAQKALAFAIPQRQVELFGCDGRLVATVDWDYWRAGYPSHLSLHQPDLEAAMCERIATYPNVELRWSREVVEIERGANGWLVTALGPRGREQAHARYLVGMDGASSYVRDALGIPMEVLHAHRERWVLTDFQVVKPLPADLDRRIYFDMSPTVPYFYGPNGLGRCRTDVRLLPDDDAQAVAADWDLAYELMEQRVGIPRDHIKGIRRVVYQFKSQIAQSMQVGTAFIGGDAAHPMTPYLGQGACTAMRDGANLAWKLDLVLRGKAAASLLDTYEIERRAHGMDFVQGSLMVWSTVNLPADEASARARDQALQSIGVISTVVPPMRQGLLRQRPDGSPAPQAGELAPQGRVRAGSREGLLDDLVGFGFQLVSMLDLDAALGAARIARLNQLGVHRIVIGRDDFADLDGTYSRYFVQHQVTTLCSRPDLYIFGVANGIEDSVALIDALLESLPAAPTASRGSFDVRC